VRASTQTRWLKGCGLPTPRQQSASALRRLLSCLKSLGAEGLAVAVFEWLDSHGYPTRDAYVLTRLMSMLPAPRALALFDRLTGAGLAPDLACFNAAISTAGARGTSRCPVSGRLVLCIIAVIWGLGLTGCPVAEGCSGSGCSSGSHARLCTNPKLAVGSTHGLLPTAGKARQWATVVDLERRMRVAGVRPDVVTFTALLTACQACRRWEDAERRWAAMLAEGASLHLSVAD